MIPRDLELLSSYLDGQLPASEAARLERRLAADEGLRAALQDLRTARGWLGRLPTRRAPRNFRLTAQMAGIRPPEPRAVPFFRLATALATFLFVMSFVLNELPPLSAGPLAAAPASSLYNAAAPAPLQSSGAGESTENPPAADHVLAGPTATLQAAPRALAPLSAQSAKGTPAAGQGSRPAWPVLELLFGGLAVICALAAGWLRLRSDRRFRARWNKS